MTESQPSSLPLEAEKEISLLSGQMEAGMAGASLTDVNLNLLQVRATLSHIKSPQEAWLSFTTHLLCSVSHPVYPLHSKDCAPMG